MNSLEGDLMAAPKIEKFILDKAKASEGMENGEDSEGKLAGNYCSSGDMDFKRFE